MSFDVAFRFVTAARYAPGACIVRWSVFPHSHPHADLRFSIYRCAGPEGPWEYVAESPVGSFQFIDFDVYSPSISRAYYYRVRAAAPSGAGYKDSKTALAAPDADPIAAEMVRKKLTYMLSQTRGVAAIFGRKTWGPNCNRCYNQQRQVATDAGCPDCFGTGYSGGYVSPVVVPAIFNPSKKAVVSAGVEYDVHQVYAEFAAIPILFPFDVVVDVRNNIRYATREVTPYSHGQSIVSQVAVLNRLDENDPHYVLEVPVPGAVEYGRGWDMLTRREDFTLSVPGADGP